MSTTTNRLQQTNEELISEEVKEIISYRPHWMIRRGNMIFLAVVLLLLLLACILNYPDRIDGMGRFVSDGSAKLVNARSEGKLAKLLISDGNRVKKGMHLGYMESTASYNEVMELRKIVDALINTTRNGDYSILPGKELLTFYNLGELQSDFQAFQTGLAETRQMFASGYYQNKINALQKDLQYIENLKKISFQKKNLYLEDQNLQKKEYEAYETLEKDKVIAPIELHAYKSKLIAREQSLKEINTQLTSNDIAYHNKQNEILDLEKQILDGQQKFQSTLLDLKSEIEKWIQLYVLSAPEDGKISFFTSLQENELIYSGQTLFYLQPSQSIFNIELMVAQRGVGKIKPGQTVIMNVDGYPSDEFGFLTGRVKSVSDMPVRSDSFLVKVKLVKGLRTNYNREIVFKNNLSVKAAIITDNRKLIDRLFGQLNDAWKR